MLSGPMDQPSKAPVAHAYELSTMVDRIKEVEAIFRDPESRVGDMVADKQVLVAHHLAAALGVAAGE